MALLEFAYTLLNDEATQTRFKNNPKAEMDSFGVTEDEQALVTARNFSEIGARIGQEIQEQSDNTIPEAQY